MTETLVIEAAKQVPALAVLVFIVMRFLDHMKNGEQTRNASFKELGDSCHLFQAQMMTRYELLMARYESTNRATQDSLNENTKALGRAGGIAERVDRLLDLMKERDHGPK